MADPAHPTVPVAPGIPAVNRYLTPEQESQLGASDFAAESGDDQWGIFTQDGTPAIRPDSVVGVEASSNYRISDYPLEKGKFETYNKVQMPRENRVTMTKGGSLASRTTFLANIEAMCGDYKLYNVVTPERTYLDVNLETITMQRTSSRGATLLTVEVQLREVRETAGVAYSKSPIEAPPPPPPEQAKRPPTTNPGTTKTPAAVKKVSRGAVAIAKPAKSGVDAVVGDLRKGGYTVTPLPNGEYSIDLRDGVRRYKP